EAARFVSSEPRVPTNKLRIATGLREPAIQPAAGFERHAARTPNHGREIDLHRWNSQPEIRSAASHVRDFGGCDGGFGRRAAEIHAGTAEILALGKSDLPARFYKRICQRDSSLASANDQNVEFQALRHTASAREGRAFRVHGRSEHRDVV